MESGEAIASRTRARRAEPQAAAINEPQTPIEDEDEEQQGAREQEPTESDKNTRLRRAISKIQADKSLDGTEKSKRIQV